MRFRLSSFLALAALLALAIPASGQQIAIGVKGGLSIADLDSDMEPFDIADASTGFAAGAFLEIGLGEYFALQPEIAYAQKGTKLDGGGTLDGFPVTFVDAELDLDYFDISLLLKPRVGLESAPVRFFALAGPYLAFEASCDISGSVTALGETLELGDCDQVVPEDPESSLDRKETDFGAVLGAGVEFDVGRAFIVLDGRYQLGLTDLNDAADATDADEFKNRSWQILAGVGVPIR